MTRFAEHGKSARLDLIYLLTGRDGLEFTESGIFTVLRPNQIKSADPVTYDNNGKPIPLSKRFDSSQNSILYSASSQEDVDIDKPISVELAKSSGLNPKTTIKQLITQAKQNFAAFFIKNSINTEISKFAQGIGITGSVPRVRAMKQKDFDEAFESVYAFASDKNNSADLQFSGMALLTKEKTSILMKKNKNCY